MCFTHPMFRIVVAGTLLVACKRELSDREACDKIAELPASTWTAADKDRCYQTYSAVGPNVRKCTDGCIRRSASASDFEDCRDDCTGAIYPTFMVCQKLSGNARRYDVCTERHEALVGEAKDVYKCWSRCGRRATNAIETEACDRTCGVPE